MSDLEKHSTALASPLDSQILIVDPFIRHLEQVCAGLAEQTKSKQANIARAADLVLVPRTYAVSEFAPARRLWLSRPCEKRTKRVFQYNRARSIWSNAELLTAINQERRPQLYVCGFWLDDVVAAAAIEAQTFAFDTHIITDLSPICSGARWRPIMDRMMQYGVVPITLHSLLFEWMANTDNGDKRQALEALWERNKQIEHEGASASRTGLS